MGGPYTAGPTLSRRRDVPLGLASDTPIAAATTARKFQCPFFSVEQEDLVRVAHALGDRTRAYLWLRLGRQQWAVQAIAGTLGITSSTVSYHIGILEDAGLVRVVRSGRYSLVERLQGPAGPLLRAVKLAVEG